MTPRKRLLVNVVGVALAAAIVAVAAALYLGNRGEGTKGRPGAPPLALDLGVRTDREARDLRRAETLYNDGKRAEAAPVFERYSSPSAEIGSAFAAWPRGSVRLLERLAVDHPRSSLVLLHLGFARFWAGEEQEAVGAWREAKRVQPDTASAGRAEDLLFPDFPRGRPLFVTADRAPPGLVSLSPPRQLAVLARRAARPDPESKLQYGLALQRLGRPLSARRQYDAAVALEPNDPQANVAAAVVRFDKARPSTAFGRLGPLTRRFPRAQTVRFHLGLLLLWLAKVQPGSVDEGKSQLRRARALGPKTPLGREASRLLSRLEDVGSS